jgi:xanthine dehydrogenase accessory factor
VKAEILERLLGRRRDKRAVVLATTLPTGEQRLIDPFGPPVEGEPASLHEAAARATSADACVTVELTDGSTVFLEPWNPPLRLVLVGAVHVAQPLSRMAAFADFEVIVVDPRSAFATEARFPGVTRVVAWPDKALSDLALDHRTAVVTLTHDPKLDDAALGVALRSSAFYVGSLGSAKTHAARLSRLREVGLSDAELARIHGPVGLRIAAQSPAEIAVSVLAQIVQVLRARQPA